MEKVAILNAMAESARATSPDATLARSLSALGNPARIAILRQLRSPTKLKDIRVAAAGEKEDDERVMARQSIKEHLERLVELGFAETRKIESEKGFPSYSVNHQGLFALIENLRELATLRPELEPSGPTMVGTPVGPAGRPKGPALVIVKGLYEGRTFSLETKAPRQRWTIGRHRQANVCLDFDPFISKENASIDWDGTGHVLQDSPSSRNGTWLNFVQMDRGTPARLETGDLVSVGRTILMYRGPSGPASPVPAAPRGRP